ncbi:MAG: 4Fe-4S dicluster domain-containing protein [Anaerolineales bacterium]|nr:4Fe-4S dicluster domain-containing protein [Anaerolineales bacterium]
MADIPLSVGTTVALPKDQLDPLLSRLRDKGYRTIGPRIRDDAVVYEPIEGLADLPRGLTSVQEAGRYRIVASGNQRYFDITPGAQSWKQFFFPPRVSLLEFQKNGGWKKHSATESAPRLALVGVRPCELAAIEIQDRAFLREDFTDPIYRDRRKNAFLVAVNCLHPCGTCFCASMGTGPKASGGFDLCLTELDEVFLVEIGTDAGLEMLKGLPLKAADKADVQKAEAGLASAKERMGRTLEIGDLPDLLLKNLEHPEWQAVAARCMSCSSCTLVCPTCFCWDTQDRTSLDGAHTERQRVWDSCFNPGYSHQAGGNTRPTTRSRYRQWLTHKFGSWKEQYGVLGCVGCGRCITWCPVKIDVTEEIAALRKEEVRS